MNWQLEVKQGIKILREKFPESIQVSLSFNAIDRQEERKKYEWIAEASVLDNDDWETPMYSRSKPSPLDAVNDLLKKRGVV